MPSLEEIQRYVAGAWQMMTGRPEGIRLLDISADGFWNSFFAIAVALPAMFAGWVTIANAWAFDEPMVASRLSILLRLAAADLSAWVLPLLAFAVAARPAGLADRFPHYVISSNWGSALIGWIMLPPTLMKLFFPEAGDVATAISLFLFAVSLVLSWRLTNSALARGAGTATAVFVAMFAVSVAVLLVMQQLLGL